MNSSEELEALRQEAITRLAVFAARNRAKLDAGETHPLVWEKWEHGEQSKIGTGWLKLWHEKPDAFTKGVQFTSSQGPNSENSFSGFIPGVSFEEAKLLVWGEYKRWCA